MDMKRFLVRLLVIVGVPVLLLLGVYLWTDPFKCLHEFDLSDTDPTNREYLSTELFLRNYEQQQYNSFIFCSSRGCGMNTYRWKTYLPKQSKPFIFQAWSESLTGIEMKMDYLDRNHVPIDNALIMIDIPGSFDEKQLQTEALSMKHFVFTGKSRFSYNAMQFFNFLQRPSLWVKCVRKTLKKDKLFCVSDTLSNDWDSQSKLSYNEVPGQDSLNNCSKVSRNEFLSRIACLTDDDIKVSEPLISTSFEKQLLHILRILERNHTDYYVILTPAFCYTNPTANPSDLERLKSIFGDDRVYDFTGKNEMTADYNNYTDPNHFGQRVGWMILEKVYGRR